jgi:predicted transglutaminase-like cysteine proteinase
LPPARIAAAIVQPANDPSGSAVNSAREKYGRQQQDARIATAVEEAKPLDAAPISVDAATAREAEPFGLDAEPASTGEVPAKWKGVEAQIRADNEILDRCRDDVSSCPLAARRFLAIIDDGRAQNGRARIGIINREINLAIVPTSDLAQWGVTDRWSPPLETFTTGRGDCEDYAIAKYAALRAAGIAPEDVRLVVVRNDDADENHAVVAVRLDSSWVILDNRWLTLVPDGELRHATPLFVLDDDGARQFVDLPVSVKLRGSPPVSF